MLDGRGPPPLPPCQCPRPSEDAPSLAPSRRFFPSGRSPGRQAGSLGGDSRLAGAHVPCTLPQGEVRNLTRFQHRWETPPQGPRRDRCGGAAGSLPHPHRPWARASEPGLAMSPH